MKYSQKRNRSNKSKLKVHRTSFSLTPNNRLTYVFKTNRLNQITEITCVSLEIRIKQKWPTIIYYDSSHGGRLHRHTRATLKDSTDVADYLGVKKKGNMNDRLRWAINDIKRKFIIYKRQFFKRSREAGIKTKIDLY